MGKDVVAFDDLAQARPLECARERSRHRAEERLPPFKDDYVRRESFCSLNRFSPRRHRERREQRQRLGIELETARVLLSGPWKEQGRVEAAEGDDLHVVAARLQLSAQPIGVMSDAASERISRADDRDSHRLASVARSAARRLSVSTGSPLVSTIE